MLANPSLDQDTLKRLLRSLGDALRSSPPDAVKAQQALHSLRVVSGSHARIEYYCAQLGALINQWLRHPGCHPEAAMQLWMTFNDFGLYLEGSYGKTSAARRVPVLEA